MQKKLNIFEKASEVCVDLRTVAGSFQQVIDRAGTSGGKSRWILAAASMVIASGCGPTGPAVQPTAGLVVMDGTPVESATVVLTPTNGGLSASAISGVDGRFNLTTTSAGRPWPGVGEGTYTVAVTKMDTPSSPTLDPSDPKYGASVDAVSAPMKYVVPKGYGDPTTSGLTATIAKGKNELKLELDSKFTPAK